MKFIEYTDKETGDLVIKVTITKNDMLIAKNLDEFDKRLLDECNKSDKVSDKLLAFHTIAKKIEG